MKPVIIITTMEDQNRLTCLRCDGTGKLRNEFGIIEKCTSCQGDDMTLEKVNADPDTDEE